MGRYMNDGMIWSSFFGFSTLTSLTYHHLWLVSPANWHCSRGVCRPHQSHFAIAPLMVAHWTDMVVMMRLVPWQTTRTNCTTMANDCLPTADLVSTRTRRCPRGMGCPRKSCHWGAIHVSTSTRIRPSCWYCNASSTSFWAFSISFLESKSDTKADVANSGLEEKCPICWDSSSMWPVAVFVPSELSILTGMPTLCRLRCPTLPQLGTTNQKATAFQKCTKNNHTPSAFLVSLLVFFELNEFFDQQISSQVTTNQPLGSFPKGQTFPPGGWRIRAAEPLAMLRLWHLRIDKWGENMWPIGKFQECHPVFCDFFWCGVNKSMAQSIEPFCLMPDDVSFSMLDDVRCSYGSFWLSSFDFFDAEFVRDLFSTKFQHRGTRADRRVVSSHLGLGLDRCLFEKIDVARRQHLTGHKMTRKQTVAICRTSYKSHQKSHFFNIPYTFGLIPTILLSPNPEKPKFSLFSLNFHRCHLVRGLKQCDGNLPSMRPGDMEAWSIVETLVCKKLEGWYIIKLKKTGNIQDLFPKTWLYI